MGRLTGHDRESRTDVESTNAKGQKTVARLEHVTKIFDGVPVVDDLNLEIFEVSSSVF